jgi:hypothetical protein
MAEQSFFPAIEVASRAVRSHARIIREFDRTHASAPLRSAAP